MSFYLALMVVASALALVKGFVFARILGATEFSYYAVLDLVVTFGTHLGTLGLLEGLNRDMPLLLGAGRRLRVRALGARGAGALLLLSAGALAVYLPGVWLSVADPRLRLTLMLGGLFSVVTNALLYLSVQLLAHQRTVFYAGMMVVKNLSVLAVGWALARSFGLWGVIGGEIATGLGIAAVVAGPFGALVGVRLGSLHHLRGVFRVGIPLMLGALIGNLARSLDRLTIAVGLSVPLFGQYSFAMLLGFGGTVLLNILAQYITPRVCHAVGAGSPLAEQRRVLDRLVVALLAAGVLVYPAFLWVLDSVFVRWFPDFIEAFRLMRVVYFGAVVQVVLIYQSVLVAAGWGAAILRQSVIVVIVALSLCGAALLLRASPMVYAGIFVAHRLLAGILAAVDARRAVARAA